jgi:hypothetical protein
MTDDEYTAYYILASWTGKCTSYTNFKGYHGPDFRGIPSYASTAYILLEFDDAAADMARVTATLIICMAVAFF